jgi:uncharacterized protein (TIGR02284 family)
MTLAAATAGPDALSSDQEPEYHHLQNLIQLCEDGREGYAIAAEQVHSSELKAFFQKHELQRAKYADELRAILERDGVETPESGTLLGDIHRVWLKVRDALTGKDDLGILAECQLGENQAFDQYSQTIERGWREDIERTLKRHYEGIITAYNDLSSLQQKLAQN